jgi:hypothetical protein
MTLRNFFLCILNLHLFLGSIIVILGTKKERIELKCNAIMK